MFDPLLQTPSQDFIRPSSIKSRRIQALRGIAIIAVVLIHSTPGGIAQVLCRPFINFSVGLFLFLSGLLSNIDKWNPKKRIFKVMIPYLIWTLVYVIPSCINNPTHLPIEYIKNMVTARSAAVMYYVFVYCELTLLIPIIDRIARSKYKWLAFFITPTEIIVMRLIPLITGIEINGYIKTIMSISCLGWFTYFYLGYLIGNGYIKLKLSTASIIVLLCGSIVLQILEGYWQYSMGQSNCGTQLKLSSILSGVLFALLAYLYIPSELLPVPKVLVLLGDYSFGIYFAHLAVMYYLLPLIPYYKYFSIYPLNAIITILITCICIYIGRKVLGNYAHYLALS